VGGASSPPSPAFRPGAGFAFSTLFGFFWSHVGWIISDKYNDTRLEYIGDFAKFPELRWLNKYHLVPPVALAVVLWLIGGWPLFIWASA